LDGIRGTYYRPLKEEWRGGKGGGRGRGAERGRGGAPAAGGRAAPARPAAARPGTGPRRAAATGPGRRTGGSGPGDAPAGAASCERTSTTIEEPRALERLGDPRREHPIALRVRVNRVRAQRGVGQHVGEYLLDQQHAFFLGELGIDRGVGQPPRDCTKNGQLR